MNKRKKTRNTRRQPAQVISTRMSGEMTGMPKQMDDMLSGKYFGSMKPKMPKKPKMPMMSKKRKSGRKPKRRR